MKRRNCVLSNESLDISKKQCLDHCAPFLTRDIQVFTSSNTCKQSGKRTAGCLEPTQSESQTELEIPSSFSFWKRFKSNFDNSTANRNMQPMSSLDAETLNSSRSNFEPNQEFNCFNYWRVLPSGVEDSACSSSQMEQEESTSAGLARSADDEFNLFNYWRTSLPNISDLRK